MKRTAILALLCAFLAFAAADIVNLELFDRLPHLEDEFAYLYQARIFARGDVYISTPEPLRAYWQPFLLSLDGRRVGKYTPGWPMVLALGVEQPWIVNAWLAMLTVALVYRLGREIYNPAVGVIAALLLAVSPAALLLNGSLMAHTAALFFVTLFVYALWRIEKKRRGLFWGLVGGLALGMVLLTRPLTAVGVAAPFVIYYAVKLIWSWTQRVWLADWLLPLVLLAVVTILVGMLWPAFNYTVTARDGESFPAYLVRFVRGDKDTNLYRYVWDYDTAGFGPGHGRVESGHTLELGWKHAKKDLKCAARDMFGWAKPSADTLTTTNPCLENGRGYSWVLLPVGFLLTIRRRWSWLLLALPVCLVAIYLTYWIGGNLYSARYYFEGLSAAALLTAVGLTELAGLLEKGYSRLNMPIDFSPRGALYGLVVVAAVYALVIYSPARFRPLRGYGRISHTQIDQVNSLRQNPFKPLVVIVRGEHHWRDVGALMAITDPYLDSDIILARDPDKRYLDDLLAQWPDREKLYYMGGTYSATLPEE
jgi:4-amino-4-deoxy-L-arabinose transferase-like glycosyltransferase